MGDKTLCGLFGSIGNNPNESTLRTLAVLNESRGSHAFGLFASDSMWIRWAEKATKCMADKGMSDWVASKVNSCWFIAGHTRWATTGNSFKTDNAHPFCYDNTLKGGGLIIGSHNGCVDAPAEYEVDSMYLFDMLEKKGGDYQKALQDIAGYFTITWTDGTFFYILSSDNELHLAQGKDGVWYYSSTLEHLEIALGPLDDDQVTVIDDGKVMRFEVVQGVVEMTAMDEFVSLAGPRWGLTTADKAKGLTGKGAGKRGSAYAAHYPTVYPTSEYDDAGLTGLDGYYKQADDLNECHVPDNDDIERLDELSEMLTDADPKDPEYDNLWNEYMELVNTCKDIYDFDEDDKPTNIHSMSDVEYMNYEMKCNNRFDDITEQVRIMG